MAKRLKVQIKRIIKIIRKPVMSILPGQLAFSFVLTIIPIIALVAIIASSFSISLESITKFISDTFPVAVSELLLPLINGRGFDFSILVFLITAFFLASGGAYSIITACDVIYKVKQNDRLSSIKKRVKSFIMTFLLLTLIMFMIIVPAFGDTILEFIRGLEVFDKFGDEIMVVYFILKFPFSFFLIYFNLKIIYTMAPSKDIKSETVTSGSIFTTILWMFISQVYSFWVTNFAHYDILYGSISNIIILLMWVYILSYVFVIGLVMNKGIENDNNEII